MRDTPDFSTRVKKRKQGRSFISNHHAKKLLVVICISIACYFFQSCQSAGKSFLVSHQAEKRTRQRINFNQDWRFMRYTGSADTLIYDTRPLITDYNDDKIADTKPTEAVQIYSNKTVLKKWILPTANDFINDPRNHHQRPAGNPGSDFPLIQNQFDDSNWEKINLPHDWAILGPFYSEKEAIVGGGMGRLPIDGVAWYRKKITINSSDLSGKVYLEIDGAMSYAMVWCNGSLAGGWPYGYNSFRIDLTPFLRSGSDNQLAIRLDNPNHSARWYPGGGIYRNVWLTKLNAIHIPPSGTHIAAIQANAETARLAMAFEVENSSSKAILVNAITQIYPLETESYPEKKRAALFNKTIEIPANRKIKIFDTLTIKNPLLWGPPPHQTPHLYSAHTRLYIKNQLVDDYETSFGIRSVQFDPWKGVVINGEAIRLKGVNQHHDLGALGAAFNSRAAERQLELLREVGCNAIRMAHNPPAPELLDLTDRMGFLVVDEIFDSWQRKKTPLDFHLIFKDWYEADLRSFLRRDRNHPSVIAWSFGNEVGEQYTNEEGAALATRLYQIVKEEDDTRPATASMNYAKPTMPFAKAMDIISLNYQGEGIRDGVAYAHLSGIRTPPLYSAFQNEFPEKLLFSSETASTLSTRGTYLFPVFNGTSAPVNDTIGSDAKTKQVSAYELYTAQFGASPDKVFATQDQHPYVAGEFVWTGWDYLGEPTPFYESRSSYSGIIDLAGFKKDRFYLYQSRWRPELPMVHILPHWNWPDRVGAITPIHVFTSGDAAELFLNGRTQGIKKKAAFEYRIRWDEVIYEPGEVKAVAYKNGMKWAEQSIHTSGKAAKIEMDADRKTIAADGSDLSFVTVKITDSLGIPVANASNKIRFTLRGFGTIVATDNGNPADFVPFPSQERAAFSGCALAIIKGQKNKPGTLIVQADSPGLKTGSLKIFTR